MGLRLTTLRARLVAATVLVAVLLAVAVVVLVQVLMAQITSGDAEDLARARVQGVLGAIHVVGGRAVLDEQVDDAGGEVLDRSVWIFDADGDLLDGRVPARVAEEVGRLKGTDRERTITLEHELLYARPVVRDGRRVAVVVSNIDLTPYEQSERRQLLLTIGLGLLTVAIAAVVAGQVATYALAPVRRMARAADAWQSHDTARRFAMGDPVDEIGELGRTLDHMLDRIASTLAGERRLTDELAHQLRTPLTVIRTEAELAARTPLDETARESITAIVATVERIEAEIRTILATARARATEPDHCDVRRVVDGLLGELPVPVEVTGRAEAGVPSGMLGTVLTPVLDNAGRHARSAVRVEVAAGDRVTVTVIDDGPGIDADDVEHVFEPGWSASGGTGLGLALARRVAASLGGTVDAIPGSGGRFVVTLPNA